MRLYRDISLSFYIFIFIIAILRIYTPDKKEQIGEGEGIERKYMTYHLERVAPNHDFRLTVAQTVLFEDEKLQQYFNSILI